MDEQKRPKIWLHLLAMLAVATLVLVLCGWCYGRHYVEKLLTQLALPCGLVWLMLLVLTYLTLLTGPRRVAFSILLIFLFYWTTGCPYTGEMMANHLESRYSHTDLANVEPFDIVIVLGGGTRSNNDGDVWLGCSGDRINLAARLYKHGKVNRLVTTGAAYAWSRNTAVSLAESTAQIWRELGIPNDDIIRIDGLNTSEEMDRIQKLLSTHPAQRVGLLTSATHLPRAQRLANHHDLEIIPIAADFQTGSLPPIPLSLIPSRKGFLLTEVCTKEFLASLVGR